MTAWADTWVERLEPERFGGGCVDHAPYVDAHLVAQLGELVDEGDVDRPVRVLEQLRHFGDVWRLHRSHQRGVVHQREQERLGKVGTGRRETADDFRGVSYVPLRVARVDALGRERQMKVDARSQTGLFENRPDELCGRAGVRGRLQHHQHAAPQHLGHGARRRLDVRQIRCLGLVERRGNTDEHGVTLGYVAHRRRRAKRAFRDERRDTRRCDVVNVARARVEAFDHTIRDIETEDAIPHLCERDRQRETDVPETDDTDGCFSRGETCSERVSHVRNAVDGTATTTMSGYCVGEGGLEPPRP